MPNHTRHKSSASTQATAVFSRRQALGWVGAWLSPFAAAATAWPTRALKMIVGFPPGSSPDLTARALSEPLAQRLGQAVVVENKVGAGGNIAAQAVAQASDGHTLGLMINGNMTIAGLLNPKLGYNPLQDLAPVSLLGTAPLLLVAPSEPGAETTVQWLARARQAGSRLSYGSPGTGTVAHLGMELLKARTGLDPVHVPYPGNPQIITALLGGQVQMALLPPGLAAVHIKSGALRALGVTSSGRSVLAPDVPSLQDAGVADFRLEIWNAVAAPASMPMAQRQHLSAVLADIVRSPEMRQRLFQQGWQVVGSSPEGLRNRIETDTRTLGDIIRQQKITLY